MTRSQNSEGCIPGPSRELRQFLRESGVDLDETFSDDEPLISSGKLDSMGLVQLILWIEARTGRAIDPGAMDLAREFDSIRLVLAYVDQAEKGTAVRRPVASPAPLSGERVEIVRYNEAHKTEVAWLQCGLWSKDPDRNIRYLEWKYEANPYGGEPVLYLAFLRDELIGMRGFYASRWEFGRPAGQRDILVADDLILGERYRNKGYVHQIMQTALADLDERGEAFVFNLSGGPLTVLSSLATGWKSAVRLEPIVRRSGMARARHTTGVILSSLPGLRRFSNLPLLREGGGRSSFKGFDRRRGHYRSTNGIRVEFSADPRPEQMARLIGQIGHDGRLRHMRDATFLDWRLRNPLAEYRFCYVGEESLDGYAILGRNTVEGAHDPKVVIADLEAIDEGTRTALLDAVVRPGVFDHLYAWSATLKPADIEFLGRAGFRSAVANYKNRRNPQILVCPTGLTRSETPWWLDGLSLLEPCNWDMRMIYSMAG